MKVTLISAMLLGALTNLAHAETVTMDLDIADTDLPCEQASLVVREDTAGSFQLEGQAVLLEQVGERVATLRATRDDREVIICLEGAQASPRSVLALVALAEPNAIAVRYEQDGVRLARLQQRTSAE